MSEALYHTHKIRELAGSLDASGANTIVWTHGSPADIERLIFVTTVAQTVADATLTVGVRDRDDGNSVNRGTFVLPFTGSVTDQVQDVMVAKSSDAQTEYVASQPAGAGFGTTKVNRQGPGLLYLKPGQELFVTSDGGGNAGTYDVFVEFFDQPWSGTRVAHSIHRTFNLS